MYLFFLQTRPVLSFQPASVPLLPPDRLFNLSRGEMLRGELGCGSHVPITFPSVAAVVVRRGKNGGFANNKYINILQI